MIRFLFLIALAVPGLSAVKPAERALPRHYVQPPPEAMGQNDWMYCQTDLPPLGVRRVAWFNLTVDKSYQRQSASLYLNTDSFAAQWDYDEDGLAGPGGMDGFIYDLPLPAGAKFPVTVNIVFDGRLAASRLYATPMENALVFRDGHIEWFQTLRLTEARTPNIFGHRTMVARAVGADGRQLTNTTIPLPDWTWLDRETRIAERDAEALRRRKRCIPAS